MLWYAVLWNVLLTTEAHPKIYWKSFIFLLEACTLCLTLANIEFSHFYSTLPLAFTIFSLNTSKIDDFMGWAACFFQRNLFFAIYR